MCHCEGEYLTVIVGNTSGYPRSNLLISAWRLLRGVLLLTYKDLSIMLPPRNDILAVFSQRISVTVRSICARTSVKYSGETEFLVRRSTYLYFTQKKPCFTDQALECISEVRLPPLVNLPGVVRPSPLPPVTKTACLK